MARTRVKIIPWLRFDWYTLEYDQAPSNLTKKLLKHMFLSTILNKHDKIWSTYLVTFTCMMIFYAKLMFLNHVVQT